MARVRVEILSPFRVTRDGEEATPKNGTRAFQVLLLLIAVAPKPVTAEEIYRVVWGVVPRAQDVSAGDRNNVHKIINALRSQLGGGISTEGPGYRFILDAEHSDSLLFEKLVAEGIAAEFADPAEAIRLLGRAIEMWPEDPLPDLRGEKWAQGMVDRLEKLYARALRGLADAYRELGDPWQARPYADRLADFRPGDEEALRLQRTVSEEAHALGEAGVLAGRVFPWRGDTVAVTVLKGDLFKQDEANLAVGFGDMYDTNTDRDEIISRKSVQGQLLEREYGGDWERLDEELQTALDKARAAVVEVLEDKERGKRKRYAIGTAVELKLPSDDRRSVFAFVHCRQDEHFVTRSTPEDLGAGLAGLWETARLGDLYAPLAMPVVGGAAARVEGMNRRVGLIKTIIASFLGYCGEKGRCANELRIIVRDQSRSWTRAEIEEIRRYVRGIGPDSRETHDPGA